MKVKKKEVRIRAIEWRGKNRSEMMDFCVDRRSGAVLCQVDGSGGLAVKTIEGVLVYPVGTMIVRGVEGEFYGVPKDQFIKKYKKIGRSIYKAANSPVIDAIQYTGKNGDSIVRCCPVFRYEGNRMQVQASWGLLNGGIGDWIMIYGQGDFAICEDSIFKKTYERVG